MNDASLQSLLLGATHDLLVALDKDWNVLQGNDAAERVFGHPIANLRGLKLHEIIMPEELDRVNSTLMSWRDSDPRAPLVFESLLKHSDGSVRNALWRVLVVEQGTAPAAFVACARDITALREAERQASKREVRMISLVAGMLDAVFTIDLHGIIQFASDSALTFFGYTPEELVGQNIKLIMPEPYRSQHDSYLERYRQTGETWILNTTREFQAVRKTGARFWVELSVSRIDIPGQAEPLICGTMRDCTIRRKAEDALKDRENRLRAIFDQEFQLVGLLDPTGRILEVNRTALDRASMSRNALLGRPFWETPWWSHDESLQTRLREWIRRAARGEFIREETSHIDHRGKRRVVDFSLKPILDEQGDVILLLPEGRDITELKRAQTREHQIMRALAAIGESTSLLVHEIKNPITSINLALRSMAHNLGQDERETLEGLVERMQSLEVTMRRTLSFAKPLDLNLTREQILPLILEPVETLRDQADSQEIEIEVAVEPGCPAVHVDGNLITEALTNLIGNAIEAIGEEGAIHIRAKPAGSAWVELTIEDDGPGISEAMQPTVFRPFFTSKDGGTGLGLALVKKIIGEHGGTIEAGSSADLGGACFTLRLPVWRP